FGHLLPQGEKEDAMPTDDRLVCRACERSAAALVLALIISPAGTFGSAQPGVRVLLALHFSPSDGPTAQAAFGDEYFS
ncbi:MAG: hypothetical protein ABI377_03330, partial [Devosia sp.]